jgi:hypothetical protein
MRKLAQRAVIAGASVLAIMSAVGGADLLGQAHANEPQCVANATDPCRPQADPLQADPPPADPPHPPRIQVYCQPVGPKSGVFCYRWIVP